MKDIKLLITLLLAILSLHLYIQIVEAGIAPNFTLQDIDGSTFSLSDFRGKVVLLDFFATWCGPCRDEMPHLKDVQEEFSEELVVISISVDPDYDTIERLKQFRQDYDITWILARDTADVHVQYNISAIPTIYLIDQEGYVRLHHIGLMEENVLTIEVSKLLPRRTFRLNIEGLNFQVLVESNSTLTDFSFNKSSMHIQFYVYGTHETIGYCNVTIPKSLLKGNPWSISIDGTPIPEFKLSENSTHSCIHFSYTHSSTKTVIIQGTWAIPEFPTSIILFIFLILLTIPLILTKKKRIY